MPRILKILQNYFPTKKIWVPHFTSVINWSLRVGLARLKNIASVSYRWIAIMDHSIDLGLKKVLVVLRVPLDVFQRRKGAVTLADVECVGVEVAEKWNAATVCDALKNCFKKAGTPCAIVKDGGSDLRAGINLLNAAEGYPQIHTIADVGHVCANALESFFSKMRAFTAFMITVKSAGARLRQTELSYLLPPKMSTKGRFQGVTRLARWARIILSTLSVPDDQPGGSQLASRLKYLLPSLAPYRGFLEKFISTSEQMEQFLGTLKNKGLNQETFQACIEILGQMPTDSKLQDTLHEWLHKTQHTSNGGNFPCRQQ